MKRLVVLLIDMVICQMAAVSTIAGSSSRIPCVVSSCFLSWHLALLCLLPPYLLHHVRMYMYLNDTDNIWFTWTSLQRYIVRCIAPRSPLHVLVNNVNQASKQVHGGFIQSQYPLPRLLNLIKFCTTPSSDTFTIFQCFLTADIKSSLELWGCTMGSSYTFVYFLRAWIFIFSRSTRALGSPLSLP